MGTKDPRVDAYIERSAEFARPILKRLRSLVHRGCPGVEETIKWGMPSFVSGGILCQMAAFRSHCAFGFWKSSLVLGEAGRPREAMGQFGKIAALSDLPSDAEIVRLVRKAAQLNAAGVRVARPAAARRKRPAAMPDDLARALARHAGARAIFAGFSPSKRRDYVEWITEARREETRRRRLETAIGWIAEGKSRNWKYER